MAPDDPLNLDDPAFRAKIEAMRKASKNPMASMTQRIQRFVEVGKEQAGAKEDLSSTRVTMSQPGKPTAPVSIAQAKPAPAPGQPQGPGSTGKFAKMMDTGRLRPAAKDTPSSPQGPGSTAKLPRQMDTGGMRTAQVPGPTGKFQKLMDASMREAGGKEDLSATQVIFLGAKKFPDRVRPPKPGEGDLTKRIKIKVVDIGGDISSRIKKDEEMAPALQKRELPADPAEYKNEDLIHIISHMSEFSAMTGPQIARLAKCEFKFWGPEEFVFKEGGSDVDKMVVVLNGTVFVRKKLMKEGRERHEQIADIKAPAIIGENSFFTGLGRSAGVYAKQRVAGIMITKEDIMRLISLDKPAMINLFGRIAEENLLRSRKTSELYMNTLQLLWSQASMKNFTYSGRIKLLERKLDLARVDINSIQDLVREVLVTIRELNIMLEDLYEFANLPVITIQMVDFTKVKFPTAVQSLRVFEAVVEDLKMQSEFVPLSSINFKDVILNAVIKTQEKGLMVNYSAIVSLSKNAYNEFSRRHKEFGFNIKYLSKEEASTLVHRVENSSLWDLDEPLFPGRKK
jgi:hypothetical protein